MSLKRCIQLRSQLTTSITAALLLLLTSLTVLRPVHAAQLDSYTQQDHNHPRIDLEVSNDVDWGDGQSIRETYEPTFNVGGLGREIVGRAAQDVTPLKNNIPITLNLSPGQTVYYMFDASAVVASNASRSLPGELPREFGGIGKRDVVVENSKLEALPELKKRQANGQSRTVYISANTCIQPASNGPDPAQLTLFVSTSTPNPGPGASDIDREVQFNEGHAGTTIETGGNVYIGIHAPTNAVAGGTWNFEVSASVDDFYFNSVPDVSAAYLLDTDSTSALLVTTNLTDSLQLVDNSSLRDFWLGKPPFFNMFIFKDNSSSMEGISNSYCALSKLAVPNLQINSSITTRNRGNNPKQQFSVGGLTPATKYWAVLAFNGVSGGNATGSQSPGVGRGGGQVWMPFQFTTKQDTNCKLVYNLPFCTNVAYAVPANSSSTLEDLVSFYDDNAEKLYKNFSISLQQIPCNTTSSAQYSLSRTCEDCDADYKNWLCAVTIPRCMDLTKIDTPAAAPEQKPQFIQPRNLKEDKHINGSIVDFAALGLNDTNRTSVWQRSSRNPEIDQVIKPGPYNELLPCIDLCYELVKSCPASMGFACPRQADLRLTSYGDLGEAWFAAQSGVLPCNWVGIDQPSVKSASMRARVTGVLWITFVTAIAMLMI